MSGIAGVARHAIGRRRARSQPRTFDTQMARPCPGAREQQHDDDACGDDSKSRIRYRQRIVDLLYPLLCPACLSKNLSAIAPCVAAAPARSAAAMSDASTTSWRVAPAACAALACVSVQYGHCVVADTAIAINSRYFLGIAPSRPTMLFRPTQALKSSGANWRISRISFKSFSS